MRKQIISSSPPQTPASNEGWLHLEDIAQVELTSTEEIEDYRVDLSGVTVLELSIIPDISGGEARASLGQVGLA